MWHHIVFSTFRSPQDCKWFRLESDGGHCQYCEEPCQKKKKKIDLSNNKNQKWAAGLQCECSLRHMASIWKDLAQGPTVGQIRWKADVSGSHQHFCASLGIQTCNIPTTVLPSLFSVPSLPEFELLVKSFCAFFIMLCICLLLWMDLSTQPGHVSTCFFIFSSLLYFSSTQPAVSGCSDGDEKGCWGQRYLTMPPPVPIVRLSWHWVATTET